MNQLTVGDVVQSKSGGPKMTVGLVIGKEGNPKAVELVAKQQGYGDGDVSCTWFDGVKKETGLFKAAMLCSA